MYVEHGTGGKPNAFVGGNRMPRPIHQAQNCPKFSPSVPELPPMVALMLGQVFV